MTITALPTPPSRNDPTNFAERGDAFLGALPQFVTEANALQADVNAKQSAAATSATNAATSATNAANSANSAATSATAAGNSATAAATSATNAGNSATAAANSAAAAGTSESNALASKNAAAQSAIDAAASRESLLALSQSIHSGAIVKALFYDTSKDSDGGAWRKRCQDKTWFNESLNGAWLGQAATAAAAWALSGAATGAYFQNTTDGKFYALGGASPAVTEVFRGNRAEFPEQAAIIAESGRVIIYDLTQSNCPMWMVFKNGSNFVLNGVGVAVTSAFALNGIVAISCSGSSAGSPAINFVADNAVLYRSAAQHSFKGDGISNRNASFWVAQVASLDIVSTVANDVAMTVLSDAPLDVASGLPIPTTAVATSGGVSVIKHDGSVVNGFNVQNAGIVHFDARNNLWWSIAAGSNIAFAQPPFGSGFGGYRYVHTTAPTPLYATNAKFAGKRAVIAHGGTLGLSQIVNEEISIGYSTKSMVSHITTAYATGWQVGDIRGAWLADIVPEVLTASGELVTNGGFATDTSGWTPTSATLSVVSGAMRVTATASAAPYSDYTATTVVGRTYKVSVQLKTPMAGKNVFINAGTGANGSNLGFVNMGTTAGTYSFDFVATTTTTHINFNGINTFVAGDFFEIDNVSLQLADPDRSVKNSGLIVNGSITKAAVATGSQLMGYSGFSAANYLEQPYNANLDFGTGDFCFIGWGNNPNGTSSGAIIDRFDVAQTGNRVYLGMSGGNWVLNCGTNSPSPFGVAVPVGVFHYVFRRISGVLSLVVNGVSVYSAANTNSVTNAAAVLDIGRSIVTTTNVWPSWLSLLRASATAPSDDQIAHIYNTEKHLFDANAKCTIDGTSTAVTALGYDDNEDALHVGTSWGRSKFRDLVRVESAATSVGSITSLSAGQGAHITGGASSARFYQPAMYLREELRRKEEARRALGKMPAFFDFDATTGQTAFALPKGWTVKAVYSAGTLKRLGSTKDYTVSFDGFVETVNFGVAPGNAVWVSVMAIRSN